MSVVRLQKVPAKRLDVRIRNVDGILVLAAGGEILELSGVGSDVWLAVDGKRTVGDIAGMIRTMYGIPVETAQADTFEFVEYLCSIRMLDPND